MYEIDRRAVLFCVFREAVIGLSEAVIVFQMHYFLVGPFGFGNTTVHAAVFCSIFAKRIKLCVVYLISYPWVRLPMDSTTTTSTSSVITTTSQILLI